MSCSICTHSKLAEIEQKLLSITDESANATLEQIASEYKVSVQEVKYHALVHGPLPVMSEGDSMKRESLARNLKLREADYLASVLSQYMVTLKDVGDRLHARANSDEDFVFEKLLTKPVVDLYIGLGSEIRSTVKTMAELESLLHGPAGGVNGLSLLAEAIRGSRTSD